MNKNLALLTSVAVFGLFAGCTLVPTDFMPKPTWYWNAKAKQYRAELKAERERNIEYHRTNHIALPLP